MMGRIISINISQRKGVAKIPVTEAELKPEYGLVGDIHAAPGPRQISLLAWESIEKQNRCLYKCPKFGSGTELLKPGDFAENLTTKGLELTELEIGDRLIIGQDIELEVTSIGKECHRYCAVYYRTGDCIMPKEGIFCRVLKGGRIKLGDEIKVEK